MPSLAWLAVRSRRTQDVLPAIDVRIIAYLLGKLPGYFWLVARHPVQISPVGHGRSLTHGVCDDSSRHFSRDLDRCTCAHGKHIWRAAAARLLVSPRLLLVVFSLRWKMSGRLRRVSLPCFGGSYWKWRSVTFTAVYAKLPSHATMQ